MTVSMLLSLMFTITSRIRMFTLTFIIIIHSCLAQAFLTTQCIAISMHHIPALISITHMEVLHSPGHISTTLVTLKVTAQTEWWLPRTVWTSRFSQHSPSKLSSTFSQNQLSMAHSAMDNTQVALQWVLEALEAALLATLTKGYHHLSIFHYKAKTILYSKSRQNSSSILTILRVATLTLIIMETTHQTRRVVSNQMLSLKEVSKCRSSKITMTDHICKQGLRSMNKSLLLKCHSSSQHFKDRLLRRVTLLR
jgi:disulfide bond formation protein DsbB